MDFSIPVNLPAELQNQLRELIKDYNDENLTAKGYTNKRQQLLERYATTTNESLLSSPSNSAKALLHKRNHSLSSTIRTQNNPSLETQSITSSTMYQHKNASSLYRVTTVRSSSLASNKSPTMLSLPLQEGASAYKPMIPLLPRSNNPAIPDSLASILRGRSQIYDRETAIISINRRAKENSISWEKLYLKAEKVAHELTRSKLYKMNKVLLWYNKDEVIEFTIALLGCFIADMVAVPVSFETYSLNEIIEIIKLTNSKFILISEECLKQLDTLHLSTNSKLKLTKSDFFSRITFLKTDDLGTYSKAKKTAPTFDIPNVSYIEFTRTPLGKLSGVVMKHKTLFNQFEMLASILNSRRKSSWKKSDIERSYKGRRSPSRYVILNSLDPTRSTGLVLGVLFNIFTGNLLISIDDRLLRQAGGYENIINRYRADVLLNDQLQLKQVVINYLENPETTISKRSKIDFNCIKWCLTSCTTIDTEVTDMIVHKWLKNLGCLDASQCYSPILTLLDFGGIFISLRDQLGNLDNFPLHDSKLRLQDELFIDKEQLKCNIIKPSITAMINSSSSTKDYLRLTTFGFPIPDSTLCVVNPDDQTLVPDLTVGEVWISSPSVTDEFYQMEKINEFVFNAKLNYKKMLDILQYTLESENTDSEVESKRLNMIMNLCSPQTSFVRTKLMGFVHNGKIYILSLIEDMFLQNKLIRLPNWSHTSDITKTKKQQEGLEKSDSEGEDLSSLRSKRVVQTYYLQHITENVVRTVDKVSEVSAFELPFNKEEHFLVMIVESTLANSSALSTPSSTDTVALIPSEQERVQAEKRVTELVEQIYKILWIFHKIQPMCILVVSPGSLPRRYCSLEIANSTVEKTFMNGGLNSRFVKFQLDNVILDFVPHSSYYNESIFSEHLSTLRHISIGENISLNTGVTPESTWQTSGIDYRDVAVDSRTSKKLTEFSNVMEILEWRSNSQGNDFAFSDGGSEISSSGGGGGGHSANTYKRVSWKAFSNIVASFIKKIVESKTPLKREDRVIVLCDNTVEYAAIVMACFYCNLVVIPLQVLHDSHPLEEVTFLLNVIKNYNVKRLFVDYKVYNLLEDNSNIGKVLKKYKNQMPKITVFSKVKKKSGISPSSFKAVLKEKFGPKTGTTPGLQPCVVWIYREYDTTRDINVVMTHPTLLNTCKVFKETLQLSSNNRIFSLCSHTTGLGFLQSCILGVYTGATTSLFSPAEVTMDPKDFLIGLQNFNVKDVLLTPEFFYLMMDKAQKLLSANSSKSAGENSRKDSKSAALSPNFLRNVQNIMIPFNGRPRVHVIQTLLRKYPLVGASSTQLNYVYQHIFNPFISLRSYLGIPPVELYLDPLSLREGIVKEVNPDTVPPGKLSEYICLHDSGIVPVCTDVSIVNPETQQPCYGDEIGEIWCCSEANAYDYYVSRTDKSVSPNRNSSQNSTKGKLSKDTFITAQFKSKIQNGVNNGLTYLRTGDLGFIRNVSRLDAQGNMLNLSVLFVLGSINETVEVLGLTHFVTDLESSIKKAHSSIANCIVVKAGGLLSCIVECRDNNLPQYSNLVPLIVGLLLKNHGVVLDLCCFVRPRSLNYIPRDWYKNRMKILNDWLNKKLKIDAQFGVNFGEMNSIYLLSDFEKDM